MSAELKACPLCNSAVEIARDGKVCWFKCTDPKSSCIGSGLGFAFLASDEAAAIAAWNRRTDLLPPPAADYVAGLEKSLGAALYEINQMKPTPSLVAIAISGKAALAARPASPDTRVVTVREALQTLLDNDDEGVINLQLSTHLDLSKMLTAIIYGGQDRG